MDFVFPSNTTESIDKIRDAIGRPVVFFLDYKVPCSACSLDPVTDTSINSFCIVCSGEGYVHNYSGISISGHITHSPSDLKQWTPGGTYPEGDCTVQIKYTNLHISTVDTAKFVIVDGKTYTIKKRTLRGVPQINRIIVNLTERNP